MFLNDRTLGVAKGSAVYDGLGNPTSHSNYSTPLAMNLVSISTQPLRLLDVNLRAWGS